MSTVFSKIINGELPAEKVFENEHLIVIKDLYPVAPVHLLIIPKKEIRNFQSLKPEDDHLILEVARTAQRMALKFNISEGYRLLTNNGAQAGQTIFHLHFHLIGGEELENLV